jgi:hypothetical protein
MINLLLRYRGWEVTYLGANVPDSQLERALEKVQPSLVVMTAARLTTAAALLETSHLLQDYHIPLAYGGSVFNSTPDLTKKIPGTYLAPDLGQAIASIENLLSAPGLEVTKSTAPNPYRGLWMEFSEKLPFLENQALLAVATDNGRAPSNGILDDAYNYLFQDILAALALGDIQFLQPNFEWVRGLMDSRNYQLDQFIQYLQAFIKITEQEMSAAAQPLLDWLQAYIQELD